MFSLGHLSLLLLAPAAVLSAPHAASNDVTSTNSETAASQLSSLVDTAVPSTPFSGEAHHVIELRADQMSPDTVIDIPADQMSGTIRAIYDPDVEAKTEIPGTSPVPVSSLVRRNPMTDKICEEHVERYMKQATFTFSHAICNPSKSEQAYTVVCKDRYGSRSSDIEKDCPENTVCYQVPDRKDKKRAADIECRSKDEVKKGVSSTARGIVKTAVKFFTAPPKKLTRLFFEARVFDRNGNPFMVNDISMHVDGSFFSSEVNTNHLFVTKKANLNGEAVFFEAYPGREWAALEWSWKRIK